MSSTKRRRVRVKSKRALKRKRNILAALSLIPVGIVAVILLNMGGMTPVNETAVEWHDVTKEDLFAVSLPEDDASHNKSTEWWSYNGHLEGQNGHTYNFQYSLFLINELTVNTVVHVSFTDETTGKRYSSQVLTAGNSSTAIKDGFDFTVAGWAMNGSGGVDKLQGSSKDFVFNLGLTSQQSPIFQNGTGLLDFKEAGKSYYYSRARMAISGYAGLGGKVTAVEGSAWFDHQWGDFRMASLGSERFTLQLNDGADITLYQLYDGGSTPMVVSGTYTKNGMSTVLSRDDLILTVLDRWKSPLSHVDYPVAWAIEIPKEAIKIRLKPVRRDSEFDARKTTYNLYWEGAMRISGSHEGLGFLEVYPLKRNDE